VAAVASIPAASIAATALVAAATVTALGSVPAPTILIAGDATATPTTISATATVPTPIVLVAAVSNPTLITQGSSTSVATVYTTSSVAWPTGKLIIASIYGQTQDVSGATPPILVGGGVTWTHKSNSQDADPKQGYLYVGYASSGTTDDIDITWPETMIECGWQFISVDDADTTDNGTNAIAQARWAQRKDGNNALSAPLYGWPFIDATNNGALIVGFRFDDGTISNTYSNSYTEVAALAVGGLRPFAFIAFKQGGSAIQPVVSWTWGGSDYNVAIVEIRAAVSPALHPFDGSDLIRGSFVSSSSNVQNYDLGSAWDPPDNSLILYAIQSNKAGGSGGATVVTAHGITFTQIGSAVTSGDYALTLWRGLAASPTSTTVQVQHGATQSGCSAIGVALLGVDTSGTNGSGAIAQSKSGAAASTSVTLTFDSAGTTEHATLGFFACDVQTANVQYPAFVPSMGQSYLSKVGSESLTGHTIPNASANAMWANSFTSTVGFTQSSATQVLGIAVEVVGSTTATPTTVAVVASIPAPTIQAGAIIAPSSVAAPAAIPAPTVAATATVGSSEVAAVAQVPAPTILLGGAATATPATVATFSSVPAPTLAAAAETMPATITAFATVPPVTAQGAGMASPASVVVIASVPAPTVIGSAPGASGPVKGPTRAEPLRDANEAKLIGLGSNSATEV
jgi:hypothetical protein